MKANLFIAIALLVSSASFAQQNDAKTKASETTTATVSTEINPGTPVSSASAATARISGSAETKANLAKKRTAEAGSAAEKKANRDEKSTVSKAREVKSTDVGINGSSEAQTGINLGSGDNKLSQDASLNTGFNASSANVKHQAKDISKNEMGTLKSSSNQMLQTTNSLKNKADKSMSEMSVKPKAASIKMHSQIRTMAAVKLK